MFDTTLLENKMFPKGNENNVVLLSIKNKNKTQHYLFSGYLKQYFVLKLKTKVYPKENPMTPTKIIGLHLPYIIIKV